MGRNYAAAAAFLPAVVPPSLLPFFDPCSAAVHSSPVQLSVRPAAWRWVGCLMGDRECGPSARSTIHPLLRASRAVAAIAPQSHPDERQKVLKSAAYPTQPNPITTELPTSRPHRYPTSHILPHTLCRTHHVAHTTSQTLRTYL